MVATLFPVDQVDTNADGIPDFPEYDGRQMRQTIGVFVSGKTPARPFGGRSGVTPGISTTAGVTVAGGVWTVTPMSGVIDAETASEAGCYLWSFDQPVTGPVTAADADDPRIDLLSVLIQDPEEGDGSTLPSVSIHYAVGVAGSGTPPAVPDQAMGLAKVNVPKVGDGAPTITWIAPFTAATGGIVPCASSADYPATPYVGQYVDDAATRRLMRWSGALWLPVGMEFCRVTRAAALAGVDSDGSRPGAWDTTYNVGDLFSVAAGAIVIARAAEVEWKTTVPLPAGTDAVAVSVEVNGTPFISGKQTAPLLGAHQSALSSVGDLHLSAGDSVQLVVSDFDKTGGASISTLANLTFSLKRVG